MMSFSLNFYIRLSRRLKQITCRLLFCILFCSFATFRSQWMFWSFEAFAYLVRRGRAMSFSRWLMNTTLVMKIR
jgi:hypothetical protein